MLALLGESQEKYKKIEECKSQIATLKETIESKIKTSKSDPRLLKSVVFICLSSQLQLIMYTNCSR